MAEEQKNMEKKLSQLAYIALLMMVIVGTVISCIQYKSSICDENMARLYLISKPYISKVQRAVKYGKPIEEFYGIESLLNKNKHEDEEIIDVAIVLHSGIRFRATNKELEGTYMVANSNVDNKWRQDEVTLTKDHSNYVLTALIKKENNIEAYYEVILSGKTINNRMIYFIILSSIGGLISIGIGIGLFRLLFRIHRNESHKLSAKIKVMCVLIVTLLIMQIPSFVLINKEHQISTRQISLDLAKSMYEQVEGVIGNKGINYNVLNEKYNLQEWLKSYVGDLYLNRVAAIYSNSGQHEVIKNTYWWPQNEEADFYIGIECDERDLYISQYNRMIYSVVLLLVMMITLKVCIAYMSQVVANQKMQEDMNALQKAINGNIEKVSLLSFTVNIICYMPAIFLPMVTTAMTHGEHIIVCSIAIGVLAAGQFIGEWVIRPTFRWIKWRYLLGIGSALLCISLWISVSVTDLRYFILYRFITGLAAGMILVALKDSLSHEIDYKKKSETYESMMEGKRLGILVGMIFGGILYNVVGKTGVYIGSTFLANLFYLIQKIVIKDVPLALKEGRQIKKRRTLKKRLLSLLFSVLIIVPTSLYFMIVSYYIPIYIQYQPQISASFIDLIVVTIIFCIGSFHIMPKLYKRLRLKLSHHLLSVILAGITSFSMILFNEALKENPGSMVVLFVMAGIVGILDGMNVHAQKESLSVEFEGEMIDSVSFMQHYEDIRLLGCLVAPTLFSLGFSENVFTYIDMTSIVGTIGVVSLGLLIVYVVISVWKSDQFYYFTKGKEERS